MQPAVLDAATGCLRSSLAPPSHDEEECETQLVCVAGLAVEGRHSSATALDCTTP